MIDRIHRFQGHGSLRFVYQKGKVVRGQFCSLKFISNSRRDTYRLAVVVSRKVHKSAVVRNRIRRRIYEIIRHEEAAICGPFDLVFTVYNDQLATMPAAELRGALVSQLKKACVLADEPAPTEAQHAIVEPKER
ncbi:MAG TPA: ribonuclease P protein component [Candidatus Saccharimonadales bacterium]|nr:ribonuclease P protein component [Candidatus Saccharimonadales bacterium]